MLDKLTSRDFAPYLNQKFVIRVDSDKQIDVDLIQVTDIGEAAYSSRRKPFSVVFRGPADQLLPQQIYPIEHPKMGRLDLFIVPIGPDDEGMRFEAVFT